VSASCSAAEVLETREPTVEPGAAGGRDGESGSGGTSEYASHVYGSSGSTGFHERDWWAGDTADVSNRTLSEESTTMIDPPPRELKFRPPNSTVPLSPMFSKNAAEPDAPGDP